MSTPIRPSRPRPAQEPARQESLRTLNLELVFRHILNAGGPISRTELASATGLARPTITRIVEELLAGRLITESGLNHDGRAGRPRVGLTLSDKGPAGLGLDIRADGLAVCVVDMTGTVRHLAFAATTYSDRSAGAVLSDLARMAQTAIEVVGEEKLTVVTGTLAVPGPVDNGVVRSAPALGWRNVDAQGLFNDATRRLGLVAKSTSLGARAAREDFDELGLPIAVDNEANLAALGELYTSDNTLDSFVYISGGLGIGAGIVLNGQLMRGSRGWGGELGHVTIHPDGKPCPCGSRGCLQTYASLQAILNDEPVTAGTTPEAVITARADAGRPDTIAALETAGTMLGIALSDLLNILDIDTVLLGGSYSLLASWLIANARAEIGQRVLTASWAPITVRPAMLGPDAAVIGAALTSIDQIRQRPTTWIRKP